MFAIYCTLVQRHWANAPLVEERPHADDGQVIEISSVSREQDIKDEYDVKPDLIENSTCDQMHRSRLLIVCKNGKRLPLCQLQSRRYKAMQPHTNQKIANMMSRMKVSLPLAIVTRFIDQYFRIRSQKHIARIVRSLLSDLEYRSR